MEAMIVPRWLASRAVQPETAGSMKVELSV